jgi:hypothetical protein
MCLASQAGPRSGDKISAEFSGPDGGPIQEKLTVEYVRQED